jgi:hypothetical protein
MFLKYPLYLPLNFHFVTVVKMIFAERRRRCLEQDENAENTNQPLPAKLKGHLQSQGFDLN